MTTKAQRRANQRNAQKSTGPKTDQGKQRCSQNALKHGLRSKHPVIPGEDPIEYQHKLDQLRADIRPVNSLEDSLVEQIADTSWRLKRLSRIEAAIGRYEIERSAAKSHNAGKDDEQILGNAFIGYSLDNLTRLARYEAQLSRRYHRATKELTDLRKNSAQTLFRSRSMEERDREQEQWRERHPQPPPEQSQPAAADPGQDSQPNEQTQTNATPLNAVVSRELDNLDPIEAVKRIDKILQLGSTTTGQTGPKEATK